MKKIINRSLFFLLVYALYTCGSSNPSSGIPSTPTNSTKSYPLADKKLWPLFEKFEKEAKQRGLTINLVTQQIQGKIEPIPEPNVGLCNSTATNNRTIIIDENFWDTKSTLKKELLVFHELGHCSLNQGHRENDADSGAICQSIMRSGHGACIDNYNSSNRKTYLDELFIRLD